MNSELAIWKGAPSADRIAYIQRHYVHDVRGDLVGHGGKIGDLYRIDATGRLHRVVAPGKDIPTAVVLNRVEQKKTA